MPPESKEGPDDSCPTPEAQSPPGPASRRDSNPPTDSLSAIRQQLHRSTVPELLLHLPTMLVEYYFSYVCQIFSSFDGTLNPFRSTVGRLWDGSAPIYYAIQSMAAAYLANHFPRMLPVGVQMQRETYRCLYQLPHGGSKAAREILDKTLLTVLLVGQTTAWHDPNDLGLVHLKTAKRLNRRRLEQQQTAVVDSRARRQNEFFEQCILYWDMLAGFVEDDIDEFGFGEFELTEPYFVIKSRRRIIIQRRERTSLSSSLDRSSTKSPEAVCTSGSCHKKVSKERCSRCSINQSPLYGSRIRHRLPSRLTRYPRSNSQSPSPGRRTACRRAPPTKQPRRCRG